MTKIVVQLENAQLQVFKEIADKLKMSVVEYIQQMVNSHSIHLKEGVADIFSLEHEPLETPDEETLQKALNYILAKNKELYNRLA